MAPKWILLSFQEEPYYNQYYRVPYSSLVLGLDDRFINEEGEDFTEEEIEFLGNLDPGARLDTPIDLSGFDTLVTTGWLN